jgi:hypothetical protein
LVLFEQNELMAIWEYKVISSGKGGFVGAKPLENFLNDFGKDEWEIIDYRPAADNPFAFTGLARRSTQREWTLEAAAVAQTKAEEERRLAEERADRLEREAVAERAIEARKRGEPEPEEEEKRDSSLRTFRDTELDSDPDALADEAAGGELNDWDEINLEDDLPSLFDAIKPHLRRNQRGLGEAAALDYLAKRWDQDTGDVVGALVECGLEVPENDDESSAYFEFEGDLYWLNRNNRGQLFINVREKPRPKFKPTTLRKLDDDAPESEDLRTEREAEEAERQAKKVAREAKEAERETARAERRAAQEAEANKPPEPLPEGLELLDVLVPKMRRNRRGPGMSGTVSFMAKALKQPEEVLLEALDSIGLRPAEEEDGKPSFVEAKGQLFWVKQDGRGGFWINARDADKAQGKSNSKSNSKAEANESSATPVADEPSKVVQPDQPKEEAAAKDAEGPKAKTKAQPGKNALPALRLLLKPKTRGAGAAGEIDSLARAMDKPVIELLEGLVKAGLVVPDEADDKPVFVELGNEIMWLKRNAKDDSLWLNAKEKPARKARAPRTKKSTAKKAASSDRSAADGEAESAD